MFCCMRCMNNLTMQHICTHFCSRVVNNHASFPSNRLTLHNEKSQSLLGHPILSSLIEWHHPCSLLPPTLAPTSKLCSVLPPRDHLHPGLDCQNLEGFPVLFTPPLIPAKIRQNPGIPVEWTGFQMDSYPFCLNSKEKLHYTKQINHIQKKLP